MGAPNPGLIFMLQIVGIGLVFYFLFLRPQAKARKQASDMLAALKKGDEVTTSGGIVGKVRDIKEHLVTIESGSAQLVVDRSRIIRVGDNAPGVG